MEVLAEIVRNLLVIIIISSFLEMLLPEGNTRPFVRFAVGMFVLIAILTPSLHYLYDNVSFRYQHGTIACRDMNPGISTTPGPGFRNR